MTDVFIGLLAAIIIGFVALILFAGAVMVAGVVVGAITVVIGGLYNILLALDKVTKK